MSTRLRAARSGGAGPLPAPKDRQRFRRALLSWYRRNGRDLPWRRTDDPYHILVSEVMLQQTQVDRVLPKYHEWLGKYPSLGALAAAHEDEVAETWRPLGYNIRPRRLHTIARESVARYGGQLPSARETLLSLRHRRVHRGRDTQLCLPRARGDRRHQRRARAVPRVRAPRRSESARDEEAPVGGVRGARAAQTRLRFQSGVDGSGGDDLRCTQSKVRALPNEEVVQFVPMA